MHFLKTSFHVFVFKQKTVDLCLIDLSRHKLSDGCAEFLAEGPKAFSKWNFKVPVHSDEN
jgi:hypothetical protein